MKRLITASDIKNIALSGKETVVVEAGTIITPAARDTALELSVNIEEKKEEGNSKGNSAIADPELIARIVQEVMASLTCSQKNIQPLKEEDPSGLRLVRGNTVVCEKFDTGNPQDKVGIKEVLTISESPHMATGIMTLEKTRFSWDLKYEEIDYIIDGTLEMTVNGRTYRGQAGDIFYLPKDTTVTFSTPEEVKFFFVTYPANWAELSNYKK